MKKFLFIILAYCISIGYVNASIRGTDTINRSQNETNLTSQKVARTATNLSSNSSDQTQRKSTTSRNNVINITRSGTNKSTIQSNVSRNANTIHTTKTVNNISTRSEPENALVRTSTTPRQNTTISTKNTINTSRAANISNVSTNTFGSGYNSCRDAYFTCMDQFCANTDDSYRRCVCSSRLTEIKNKEKALSEASGQVQNFKNLNIQIIDKTTNEVKAMLSASEGEESITQDTSNSAQQLSNISEILSTSKKSSLSTLGSLDIAGDINQIWATTNLTSGENIANLTGESLYNAVHSQCVDLISSSCDSESTLAMVIAAYGMYIENDCTTLSNALDKSLNSANSTIRETEREMNLARLENYNAHNSTGINDCVAKVREDITSESACGKDYVHCLDVTGLYLNKDTGAPIYSQNFFQLENQTSLSGDVLTNSTNRLIVAELEKKRLFANESLDTCRDISEEVWDEFMRQAIVEIYQGQQEKIRTVKNECLDVVNQCYDSQTKSLKDFSNIQEELLLGSRLELSEELCQEKLLACSNLYGDPDTNGLELLVNAMHEINDQKIAENCSTLLKTFMTSICAVAGNDTLHSYPYGCRAYSPGEEIYASNISCNQLSSDTEETDPAINQNADCGSDYNGSLYQKAVKYAIQYCVRPSDSNAIMSGQKEIPINVLQDVNNIMDSVRVDMSISLSKECERLGGVWVDTPWLDEEDSKDPELSNGDGMHDKTGHVLYKYFYDETGTNTSWGYCADKDSTISVLSN